VGIPVGSRVQLDIPVALAYPNGDGPAGDLRFVVDILKAE
jgi:peptidylprolyl isomerase